MASLDDFFAKKDKKKGKSKKSIISNDELVRQLEETESKETLEEVIPSNKTIVEEPTENEDEEWASNVEESKRVDFSNLKLGQLTMTDEQEQKQNLTDAESSKLQNDDSENPWSKQTGASNAQPSSTVVENNKPVSNIYVPPSVIKGEMLKNRKKKNLPDLASEGQFPELGTNKPVDRGLSKKDGFEEVKHGAAYKNVQSQQAPVSIGNTYSSLLNDSESS